jgi:hypothetical protein
MLFFVSRLDRGVFASVDSIGRGYSVFWSLSCRILTGKFGYSKDADSDYDVEEEKTA